MTVQWGLCNLHVLCLPFCKGLAWGPTALSLAGGTEQF